MPAFILREQKNLLLELEITMEESEKYILKGKKRLQRGYTTGSCAAAAAAAAVEMILGKKDITHVKLKTPKGIVLHLEVEQKSVRDKEVSCAVKKFSGDDPDITNGVYVYARVTLTEQGICLTGGKGIGRITKPGLALKVGQPAINPVPRKMILKEAEELCEKYHYLGGLQIEISIPQGEKLAEKTFNPKLGIVGGISVLGTTGIVEPMSNSALIETIRLEIDMRKAEGATSILVVPGNYGRDFAQNQFGIDIKKAVQCSNFIGETLDYIAHIGFDRVLFMGHGGKLVKVAGGIMNTHSSMADCRMEIITAHAARIRTIEPETAKKLLGCVTIDAANDMLKELGIANRVWESIGEQITYHMKNRLGQNIQLFTVVFGGDGVLFQQGNTEKIKNLFGDESLFI